MSTREDDLEDAIGSDSFLDIASNIVGVLIILVLVGATRLPTRFRWKRRGRRSPVLECRNRPSGGAMTVRPGRGPDV